MRLIISADQAQIQELSLKKISDGVEVIYLDNGKRLFEFIDADGFFILNRDITSHDAMKLQNKPVFLNSVPLTLDMLGMPKNVCRVNGWTTFLKNNIWEVTCADETLVRGIFQNMGWQYTLVEDHPGFVSARIIAMIINEAYFALADRVSSKSEIDIAMKLGTNYPYGPFEWCEKIGLKNIHSLLITLKQESDRYNIAPALQEELASFIH
jgi:3-hydroxybutyryl-CoA dehydrogenase